MNRLFVDFDPVSKNKWLEQIDSDLKGNTEKLISTVEGITIQPIYHADDNFKTYNSNFPSNWETYQLIDATNAKEANKRALNALQNDVSGLFVSQGVAGLDCLPKTALALRLLPGRVPCCWKLWRVEWILFNPFPSLPTSLKHGDCRGAVPSRLSIISIRPCDALSLLERRSWIQEC